MFFIKIMNNVYNVSLFHFVLVSVSIIIIHQYKTKQSVMLERFSFLPIIECHLPQISRFLCLYGRSSGFDFQVHYVYFVTVTLLTL